MKKKFLKEKNLVLKFLNTKFENSQLKIEIGDYSREDFWSEWTNYSLNGMIVFHVIRRADFHQANISNIMVYELISWFGKMRYKRRYFKEWFFEKYDVKLPQDCEILIR